MRVHFVLSTFNQAGKIIGDLINMDTVIANYPDFDCSLYLLNNGSTDATKEQLVNFMAEKRIAFKIFLVEEEQVLGPAQTASRLLQVALAEPSDYIIKLDSHREVPHRLVIHKFLKQLTQLENPLHHVLTGLKSVMNTAPKKNIRKYRQEQLAEEMAASFSASNYFQDAINAQGFASDILQQLLESKEFASNAGRRGWELLLALQAKKKGCQLTTVPFYPEEIISAKDRNFGVSFKNDTVQVMLKRFSATN